MSERNPTEASQPTQAPERRFTYKGRDLESLTHAELLTACQWAYREIEQMRRWAEKEREMAALFDSAARQIAQGRR